jgi:hypothetical protein
MADKGKISFFKPYTPDTGNPLNCSGLRNVTTQPVDGISRINNYTPLTEYLNNLQDLPLAGSFRVDSH